MSFPVFDARFIRSFLFFSVFLQCGLDLGFWRLDFGYWRPSFAIGGERLRKNLAHRSLRSGKKKKKGRNKFATAGFKSWLLWSMCRLEKECSDSEWGVKKAKFIEIRNAASAVE